MHLRTVTRRLALTASMTALALVAPLPTVQAEEPGASTAQPSYLFTVEAPDGTTTILKPRGTVERMRLTLNGVEPVTMFTDRPLRNARLISPTALSTHWSTWFADSPPNAVLTWSAGAGKAPSSFVVTLTDVDYDADRRQLTFTAERDPRKHDPAEKGPNWQRRTTPSTFTQASLFIDNAGVTIVNGCTIASNSSCPGADLSGANLSRLWMTAGPILNFNAAGANVTNANAKMVVFGSSDFTGSDFTGTDLGSANIVSSAMDQITAPFVNLAGSTLDYSTFTDANLQWANLSSGTAMGADFTNANLAGVDFSWKDLSRADFSGANLVGANFTGARIDGTKFYGADLTAATITGLSFQMTNVNTICPDGTQGYCAPWSPGPDDLPVDRPSGAGDWECTTTSEFDPYKLKRVPVTRCGPVS